VAFALATVGIRQVCEAGVWCICMYVILVYIHAGVCRQVCVHMCVILVYIHADVCAAVTADATLQGS
jgi:hypothetical protein